MTAPKLTGNRCRACGEYFSSPRSFDRHRVRNFAKDGQPNTRRCVPIADLLANGWNRNACRFMQEPHAGRAPADIQAPRSIPAMVRRGGEHARA